jgi:hypothetical protein
MFAYHPQPGFGGPDGRKVYLESLRCSSKKITFLSRILTLPSSGGNGFFVSLHAFADLTAYVVFALGDVQMCDPFPLGP